MMQKRLTAIALVLLVAILVAWVVFSPSRVLQSVEIKSALQRVETSQVENALAPYLGQSFWRVDLEHVHADLVKLDWVYKASVKRRWPSKLIVHITEQNPVVRWGSDALLNQEGDVFYPYDISPFLDLVMLDGEALQSKALLKQLVVFQSQFTKLGWTIDKLTVQADGVWRIHFLEGATVLLGKEDWQGRLNRFIQAYPKTQKELRKFAQVFDLRYSNGFVIESAKQADLRAK